VLLFVDSFPLYFNRKCREFWRFAIVGISTIYIEPSMTSLASLRKKINAVEKKIDTCQKFNDLIGYADERDKLQILKNQEAAIKESLKERGTIGWFDSDVSPKEILNRRKRSATIVGDQAQLPLMAQNNVVFPNVLLRSALFGIWSPKVSRQALAREPIACEGGLSIVFSGERLWQKDFLLMAAVLRLTSDDLGKPVIISVRQFLKMLGSDDGGSNYESLFDSLRRLSIASVVIRNEGNEVSFDGLLNYKPINSDQARMVELSVDRKWAELFGIARWSAIEFDKLTGLDKKKLAVWLAAYLATHDGKKTIALSRLYDASGASTEKRAFRRSLRTALEDCVTAGFLLEARLTDDDEVEFCPVRRRRLN
jgi:hypothetical protein